jgi:hypothetical protein
MKKFNSLDDLFDYVDYVRNMTTDESSMIEIKSFAKLSAERIARQFYLNEKEFVKRFNKIKKEINFKLLMYNNIKNLRKRSIEKVYMNLNNKVLVSNSCICTKFFEVRFMSKNIRFYPSIEYQYINGDGLIIYTCNESKHLNKLYLTNDEFNQHFLDIREFKINQILD